MRKYLYILFLMMFAGIPVSEVCADDGWVNVFFNDFGGNEKTDPLFGPQLSKDETAEFFEGLNGDTLIFEYDYECKYGYCVLKHFDDNSDWYNGGDHTYSSDREKGYFVLFNPANSAKKEVVYKTKLTGLCQGVTFRFSAYVADLMQPNKPGSVNAIKLSVGVYDGPDPEKNALVSQSAYQNLGLSVSNHSVTDQCLDWQELSMTFTLNSDATEAYFILSMEQPTAQGWDFAIDDISIDVWKPEVTISTDDIYYEQPVDLKASFSNNGFFSDMNQVVYSWEYSSNGLDYSPLKDGSYPNDPDFSYEIEKFNKANNNGYYRVKIGQSGNMDSKVCTLTQTSQIDETMDKKLVTLCSSDVKTVDGIEFDAELWNDGDIRHVGNVDYYIKIKEPKKTTLRTEYLCVDAVYNGPAEEYKGKSFSSEQILEGKKEYFDTEGCLDSVVTWPIQVTYPAVSDRAKTVICQGDTAFDKVYDQVGTFNELDSIAECVSERRTIVVNPTYDMTETIYLCQDESFNGKQYHENGGPFYDAVTYKTKTCGCDSTVGYTIYVSGKTITNLEPVTICYGESYEFDGITYTEPKVYHLDKEFSNSSTGCDSVVLQTLTILDKIENKDNPIDTLICYDSKLFGVVYHDPTPQNSPILVRDPQTYTSENGCDSIVWYNLTVLQIQLKLEIKSDRNTVCKGEEVEIYIKELIPNNVPFTWYPDLGGSNSQKKNFTPAEDVDCVVKAERVIDANSTCQTTDTIHVYVRESPVLSIDSVNQKENIVGYSVTGGTEPYEIFLDKKSVGSDVSGELHDSPIGSHKLVARDKNECEDAGYFDITPIPVIPATYFTPNNDGVNDTWLIENVDVYPRCNVKVYDRFGRIVYEQDAYDNEDAWDGTYAGNPLPASDYWYVINLPESDRQLMGHFTLIR